MKKGLKVLCFVAIFAVFWFFVFSIGFGSAAYYPDLRGVSEQIVDFYVQLFEPILSALFGGFGWSGLYLFERFLVFILLMSVIYVAVGSFPIFEDKKFVRGIISVVVPLIGMRFIDYEWFNSILMQYQAVTIILASILPFIVYFYFLYSVAGDYYILRKIGWVIFSGIYAGLWFSADNSGNSQIFFWTLAVSLFCLFFDEKIDRKIRALKMHREDVHFREREIGNINQQIQMIHAQMNSGALKERIGNKAIKDLTKHKNWLMKLN